MTAPPAPPARSTVPRVTLALCGANVAMYVVMAAAGVAFEDGREMLRWGADFGPLTLHGEWWRLGSSMFLHFGFLHLAFNMWALFQLGRVAERLLGWRPFLAMYVLSGLGGSVGSVLVHPMVVGAGASGAIFGVAGGLIVALRFIPSTNVGPLGRLLPSLLSFVFYNLFFGFTVPGIDNMAHIGGLATGAAFAAALVLRPATSLAITGGAIALILAAGAFITRLVRAPLTAQFWPAESPAVSLPDVAREAKRLERLVAQRPDSIELYTALGTAYMEENLFGDAVNVLQRARAKRPSDEKVLTALGTVYLDQDRWDDAITAFGAVFRRDSADADARYNLAAAYFLRGVGLADSGAVERARSDFERVLQISRDSQLVSQARGQLRTL
ncbi:MAG TPA: rhomboid family intramembrane serine protease, partial [Gemmatimonadales bacterium]